MSKKIELSGETFSRLLVVDQAPTTAGRLRWNCKCECGSLTVVLGSHLRTGRTKSCGCLNIDFVSERFRKHGMHGTTTYISWKAMKQRCGNPKQDNYGNYGGRGISICSRWLESFEEFYTDMGRRPEGMTLDRKNNEGNYEPDNCRWASHSEQINNRRHST